MLIKFFAKLPSITPSNYISRDKFGFTIFYFFEHFANTRSEMIFIPKFNCEERGFVQDKSKL
uniref:Uncharacterized protein n=1 Tax=Meloidogyne incognita TaxID=6306 RepID=A0A914KFH6_MELIC